MRKFSWMLLSLLTASLWAAEGEKAENHVPLVTNVVAEQVDFEHVLIRYDVEDVGQFMQFVELSGYLSK